MPKVENPLLQLKNVVLVERPQINKEQARLPRAAVPCYYSEDLSYFSFYSCRPKN